MKLATIVSLLWLMPAATAMAQTESEPEAESTTITTSNNPADEDIQRRLESIFSQIDTLSEVEVSVREGVVFLSGSAPNDAEADRARNLAGRLDGVVTIDESITRNLEVREKIVPLLEQLKTSLDLGLNALPLFGLAFGIFVLMAYLGHRFAKWSSLWRRLAPNPFLADLIAQAVRVAIIILGLVLALRLIGATALVGTILGGAGVIGLAIGFSVRDALENYISSIMLSIRQPFRANDHVVIDEHEGKVARLTSRATVLMTLDGNHLRIPNSVVFKAVILNYTRNPERRFEFDLGVDANDDPVAAMQVGVEALCKLPFVLDEPEPNAIISAVGDSNIVIRFMAWVDQRVSDFGKSRSLAIRASKAVLEDQGFTLPEPIYRLRVDQSQACLALSNETADEPEQTPESAGNTDSGEAEIDMDVSPDTHLEERVSRERALNHDDDLLDSDRPVE